MNTLITDCSGVKADALAGVLRGTDFSMEVVQGVKRKEGFKTPLSFEDLNKTLLERLNFIVATNHERSASAFSGSIQRAYIFDGVLWNLIAGVIVRTGEGRFCCAYTATVPVPEMVSKKKSKSEETSMRTFLLEEFPKWDSEKVSVFTLLTGEDEKLWLQAPVRYCRNHLQK